MKKDSFFDILITVPIELQFGVVIFLGILFVLIIKMKHSNNFKETLIESKKIKSELVKYLLKNLDALDYLSKKLLNDKEIILEFNTDTAILALKAIYNIEKVFNKLAFLEDGPLTTLIESYTKDAKYIISSIYNIENDIYEKKKDHQHLLHQYDREFNMLTQHTNNSDRIQELRSAFKEEMYAYKEKVKMLEKMYSSQREELAALIKELDSKNENIQNMLIGYRKKEVESKKLYLKEFVYA